MYRDLDVYQPDTSWIGNLPEGWNLVRSKYLFRNRSEKNFLTEQLLSVTQKNGVVIRSESETKVWNPTDDVSGYKLIVPGDFVISLRSFEGGIELSKIRGIVSPTYVVLEPIKTIEENYFWWLMKSRQFITELNKNVTGIRQGKTIGWDDFSNIYLPIPPMVEQTKISRYLDKKTEQIDSLIEKIQKKIELLKEQRISLINQCVTEGLDPTVEMKDSGVEWIDEIPKHWSRGSLKQFTIMITDGAHISPDTSSEDQYFISTVDITDGEIDFENCLRTSQVTYDYLVKTGCKPIENDILFSKDGTIGKTSLVNQEDFVVASSLIIIRPNRQNFLPKYLEMVLQSHTVLDQIESMVRGAALRRVSLKNINSVGILVPPLIEQKSMIEVLTSKEKHIKNVFKIEEKRLRLLSEFRQSLISSVVTGKIRVTEDMV